MARLYCETHGIDAEADCIAGQEAYRQADEISLVVSGRLTSGPFVCDRCNARLYAGDAAYLVSAFPSFCRDDLLDYGFGYERAYFAMSEDDKAVSYGAAWPDDSLTHRRRPSRKPKAPQPRVCALDFERDK